MPRIMTFNYNMNPEQLLFTLDDQPILSIGNLMGITADIGVGKSQICEIFAAYWLNPSQATHNIQCVNNDGRCMYIDTERTPNDCYNGLVRIKNHSQLTQEDIEKKLIYTSTIDCLTINERLTYIRELLLQHPEVRLVILDTLLDCVNNPNDLNESNLLCQDIVAMANTHHIALIYSLHGNRNDKSGKGKGHIGDSFQRKSESYLKLIPHSNVKVLTSDFPNGKVRNGYNKVSTSFEWNNNIKSLLEQSTKQTISVNPFEIIFKDNQQLKHKELVEQYRHLTSLSERTATKHIKDAVTISVLLKTYNLYSLNI